MQHRIPRSVASLIAVAASAAGFASLAQAQVGPMDPSQMLKHQAEQAPDMTKPHVVPPPALPGATSRTDSVAPATRIPSDMSPNDALFDAINRGDIAAARDALSRGADLNAQNMLGMTPMELSVDLGRNDISFLLLSYRGMDGSPSGQAQAQTATPAPAPGKAAAKSRARASVMPVKEVAPAPPQAPRLFANDGGAPVPGAGFLGFDAGRSER